jgi:DNA-binding response OmpR family regulator
MGSGEKVLLVDDEPVVCDVLDRYLTREGFAVSSVADGKAAITAFDEAAGDGSGFAIVVLDLMLPGMDGLDVLRRLRARDSTPVIMLTARGDVRDRIDGLELGADDYVVKPFSPSEVVSRVRAVLRRGGRSGQPEPAEIEAGELRIDRTARQCRRGGDVIALKPREFDLLCFLATHPGRVFSRFELLERLWDQAFEGDESTVTVHMSRLRDKVEVDPARPRHLVTVWGAGYRFDP